VTNKLFQTFFFSLSCAMFNWY